jgi:hypothetical protein
MWTTADYALILSLIAAFISLANFGWSVWSKFIFPKPRLKVKLTHVIAVGHQIEDFPNAIGATAINYGPTDLTLIALVGWVSPASPFSKSRRAVLRAFDDYPNSLNATIGASVGLPIRLKPGESHTIYLPETPKIFREIRNIGFSDGFGREHFSDRQGKRILRELSKE